MFKQLLTITALAGVITSPILSSSYDSYEVQKQIDATIKKNEIAKKFESMHSQLQQLRNKYEASTSWYLFATAITGVMATGAIISRLDPQAPSSSIASNRELGTCITAFLFCLYNAIQSGKTYEQVGNVKHLAYDVQPQSILQYY